MIRLLVFALLAYFLYRLIKRKLKELFPSEDSRSVPTPSKRDEMAPLIRDPECGTYFDKREGVKAVIQGQNLYFCSPACRDAFLDKVESGSGKRKAR